MAEEAKQATPHYVVLKSTGEGYTEVAVIEARSRDEAIKTATSDGNGGHIAGRYRAVPERSWSDVIEIISETKTVSTFRRVGDEDAASTFEKPTDA